LLTDSGQFLVQLTKSSFIRNNEWFNIGWIFTVGNFPQLLVISKAFIYEISQYGDESLFFVLPLFQLIEIIVTEFTFSGISITCLVSVLVTFSATSAITGTVFYVLGFLPLFLGTSSGSSIFCASLETSDIFISGTSERGYLISSYWIF